jgi:hypothetical protein
MRWARYFELGVKDPISAGRRMNSIKNPRLLPGRNRSSSTAAAATLLAGAVLPLRLPRARFESVFEGMGADFDMA